MKSLFLFAGEASGDLHGSRLAEALKEAEPTLSLSGVGGPRMRRKNFTCIVPMEEFQVMGLTDVITALPRLWGLFRKIRSFILSSNPDGVVLIDYPGFNLRLAKSLRKQGYRGKLIHYICPSVWAHGKGRIDTLSNCYDLLLTIYPFESAYFAHTSLKVEYVGNPLIETLQTHHYQDNWKNKMSLPSDQPIIALFPGSRIGEIDRHAPQQLKIAAELKERHPQLHFALSCSQEALIAPLLAVVNQSPLRLGRDLTLIPPDAHYDLMRNCQAALAKSGTVTLELALHSVPTVVHYELSQINYFFAKHLLRLNLPYYCIVNILGNETIFPEFVGRQLSLQAIKDALEQLHTDPQRHQNIRNRCCELKESLGNYPTQKQAAKAILEQIRC